MRARLDRRQLGSAKNASSLLKVVACASYMYTDAE